MFVLSSCVLCRPVPVWPWRRLAESPGFFGLFEFTRKVMSALAVARIRTSPDERVEYISFDLRWPSLVSQAPTI